MHLPSPDPAAVPETTCGPGCGHDHDHEHNHGAEGHSHGPGFFFYLELGVLLLWGVVLIVFMTNGRIVNFLTPAGILREQVFIGGFVLLIMAVFNFLNRNATCDCGHDHTHGSEGHSHDNPGAFSRVVTLALLACPVGYAWAKSPDGYSAELQTAMANSITAQVNTNRAAKPRPPGGGAYTIETFRQQLGVAAEGPIPLDAQSFFYNGGDAEMRKILDGQEIEITARVVKNTIGKKPNRLRMYDLEVTCCAADARPFSFPIEFKGAPPEYIERGWYKVTGKAMFEEERGNMVALLLVDDMTPTTRPASQGRAY